MNWEDSSWKHLSLIGGEKVISLLHTKVCVFSDSALCLCKIHENLQSNTAWEERLAKVHRNTEPWTELMVSQLNSSGKIFPGLNTLQLSQEVKSYC